MFLPESNMKAGGKAKLEMRVFCSRSMPSGSGAVPSSVEKKKEKSTSAGQPKLRLTWPSQCHHGQDGLLND